MTDTEISCLESIAAAMKQQLEDFGAFPPKGHPILEVFWAWSYINKTLYRNEQLIKAAE